MKMNLTQLCHLDQMNDDNNILARCISIWKSHPLGKPNEVWSLDAVLQDQHGTTITRVGSFDNNPHGFKFEHFTAFTARKFIEIELCGPAEEDHHTEGCSKLRMKQKSQYKKYCRSKSIDHVLEVTDDDVKELTTCFDLGFGFDKVDDFDDPKLLDAFPALKMYGDDPEKVKMKLKQWAKLVRYSILEISSNNKNVAE
nr:replication protein A 70 kDa DNA-binding subunit B [Tanacetum cinerariifolium]